MSTRHGLPGDLEDTHTRYFEAAIAACLSDASICRKANPGAKPSNIEKGAQFARVVRVLKLAERLGLQMRATTPHSMCCLSGAVFAFVESRKPVVRSFALCL